MLVAVGGSVFWFQRTEEQASSGRNLEEFRHLFSDLVYKAESCIYFCFNGKFWSFIIFSNFGLNYNNSILSVPIWMLVTVGGSVF